MLSAPAQDHRQRQQGEPKRGQVDASRNADRVEDERDQRGDEEDEGKRHSAKPSTANPARFYLLLITSRIRLTRPVPTRLISARRSSRWMTRHTPASSKNPSSRMISA